MAWAGRVEHEAEERSMGEQRETPGAGTAAEEPPSHWDMWMTTLDLASDMAEVLKDGVEEEVAMVYEALDQTFKWNERRRERVENAHNELIRLQSPSSLCLNRQIEAKKDALEKLKSNSTARENQAEIYALEQLAYEEARKIKARPSPSIPAFKRKEEKIHHAMLFFLSQELDAGIGSIKAHTSKLQTQIQELEQSDSTRSPEFVIGASVLKAKLYHDLGFVQVRSPLQESTNAPQSDKLFIRMLFQGVIRTARLLGSFISPRLTGMDLPSRTRYGMLFHDTTSCRSCSSPHV
ncbi:uncharacterized protein VP01_87g7 [Puccinia sorghi]|uniref:Kinetochore protein Spc24 n=1 Tax=Puccinia sorghi TaxID=27349 RepID=A0A0L6U8D1_9BASI|nr:uncharacterized protein VP01_87g7 [Puccinia sorghi]